MKKVKMAEFWGSLSYGKDEGCDGKGAEGYGNAEGYEKECGETCKANIQPFTFAHYVLCLF